MTFLIADDNVPMRESLKGYIVKKIPDHHTFLDAANGAEAVTLYQQNAPDYVLMDIEMESMDGFTAMKKIRDADPDARIIIVTSYDDGAYRRAARSGGAIGYVVKEHLEDLRTIIAGTEKQ